MYTSNGLLLRTHSVIKRLDEYELCNLSHMLLLLLYLYSTLCFLSYRMLSYTESGIVKHLQTKDLPEAVICPLNLGSKERQLRNSDLFTTYAVVVCGFSVAVAVFTVEVVFTRTGWFAAAAGLSPGRRFDGVRCEIASYGRPSKPVYPFSHRENVVDAASSAARFALQDDRRRREVAAVSSSMLLFDRKSSLRRFQY